MREKHISHVLNTVSAHISGANFNMSSRKGLDRWLQLPEYLHCVPDNHHFNLTVSSYQFACQQWKANTHFINAYIGMGYDSFKDQNTAISNI